MDLSMIEIKDIRKRYILGAITGKTLKADVQSLWAKIRKKDNPNIPLHLMNRQVGMSFMALNGVSFNVKKGERVGIVGGNGAGKSTLLKILSRITSPTEGEVILRGRVISMLEVGTGFHPEMTGRENVYLNGAILGMTRSQISEKMNEIIEFSEVGEFIDTPVKRYSSGMYVKLAFSVAAHLDSEIIIMDEILAVGDIQFQQKCLNKMYETSLAEDKTILYVSHNMATIRQLCNRCIVLNEGKLAFDGEVEKAIGVYSTLEEITTRTRDLAYINRPKSSENLVMMEKIELCDRESAIYARGEKIKVEIMFHPKLDYEAYLEMVVKTLDGMVIACARTPYDKVLFFEKETKKGYTLSLDFLNIASGKYLIDFYLISSKHTNIRADAIEKVIFFEISKDHNKIRDERVAGLIELNNIEVV